MERVQGQSCKTRRNSAPPSKGDRKVGRRERLGRRFSGIRQRVNEADGAEDDLSIKHFFFFLIKLGKTSK